MNYVVTEIKPSLNALQFCDPDIQERFADQSSYLTGVPTMMQLVKGLRLTRGALVSLTKQITRQNL